MYPFKIIVRVDGEDLVWIRFAKDRNVAENSVLDICRREFFDKKWKLISVERVENV